MHSQKAFTLIELSIVLVIIGLIVGGVLVGRDLIAQAAVRSIISQTDAYKTAANTFYSKYGFLPGDIKEPDATNFGFVARGSLRGEGDGNGVIEGTTASGSPLGNTYAAGETVLFWRDLSTARLIGDSFNTAVGHVGTGTDVPVTGIGKYFPASKLGQGGFVYIYSHGTYSSGWQSNFVNYMGISAVTGILTASASGKINSAPSFTVSQAYVIDKKIDDGLPQFGKVLGSLLNQDPRWCDGYNMLYDPIVTTALAGSSTSCCDNGNATGVRNYSITQNNGAGMNCGIMIGLQ